MSHDHQLVVILLVAVVLAAGCGGDGSDYAAEADAICAGVVADSRVLYQKTAAARSAARDHAVGRIVRARGAALDELHKLALPLAKRYQTKRMLAHFDKSQHLLRQAEQSWGQNEQAPFLLVSASHEADKGHALARELALDDCAEF